MSLMKRNRRKKNGEADQHLRESNNEHRVSSEGYATPSEHAWDGAIESNVENHPELEPDGALETLDLSESLMQLAADDNRDSSPHVEAEAEGSVRSEVVDALTGAYQSDASYVSHVLTTNLVDPSKWFELRDSDSGVRWAEEQQENLDEEGSSAVRCARTPEDLSDGAPSSDVNYVTAENDYQISREAIIVNAEEAKRPSYDERRRHPREETSDLIWVEYFDSSMECTAKEAARVENVGGGGMRVAVRAAPPELERVIVSYPYRGFESCSIVRSRFQGEDGQERLCLEFADREWNVNAPFAQEESQADQINPQKILLADDDSAFRKILGKVLIKAGYDVVLAEDGESAVRKAKHEIPNLVITDGLMPKLHGFQVCKAVKELTPQPKVIMLTAVYTTPNYMWEAKAKFGADDIMTKPCQISDLLRRIDRQLPRSRRVA